MTALPIMIFAAGFGTRMGALTRDIPKPMIHVGGRALIDHALTLVEAHGAGPVVINLHYRADVLQAHLADQPATLLTETPDILDTGGGLKAALPHLGQGPVMTLNPDAIWSGPNPLDMLRAAWDDAEMDALLLCVPLQHALGREGPGDFEDSGAGRITRPGPLVYGGVQIIRTELVQACPDKVFSLNRIWDQMIDKRRLRLAVYPGTWCDVGRPEGIGLAESLLAGDHV